MTNAPVLLPTSAQAETFAGITYHVDGELVPVLTVELSGVPIYFEHHVLLWKDPRTEIAIRPVAGAFKRMIAGMPVFMTQASGPGRIAFSRDGVGHIYAVHLSRGQRIDVREHQFLAASGQVDFTFTRVRGAANVLLGGTGFFIDTFTSAGGEGILWLHGYGNVFEITLGPGERIDVEPGGWIYKDPTVTMATEFQRLSTSIFAGSGQLVWNRFTGPGKLALQSMYVHFGASE
jgi:uncharacterized protein (AIM24 family)